MKRDLRENRYIGLSDVWNPPQTALFTRNPLNTNKDEMYTFLKRYWWKLQTGWCFPIICHYKSNGITCDFYFANTTGCKIIQILPKVVMFVMTHEKQLQKLQYKIKLQL